jgi:hypothetical protein
MLPPQVPPGPNARFVGYELIPAHVRTCSSHLRPCAQWYQRLALLWVTTGSPAATSSPASFLLHLHAV